MTAAQNNYRPDVGTTLFVSLFQQMPVLITVTGYHFDARFKSEQFDFTCKKERPRSTSLDTATFYPDAPADSEFIYVVEGFEEHEDAHTDVSQVGHFFDPKSAFDFMDSITKGERRLPRLFEDYRVCVERLQPGAV